MGHGCLHVDVLSHHKAHHTTLKGSDWWPSQFASHPGANTQKPQQKVCWHISSLPKRDPHI